MDGMVQTILPFMSVAVHARPNKGRGMTFFWDTRIAHSGPEYSTKSSEHLKNLGNQIG
jgi:hypothetical protein